MLDFGFVSIVFKVIEERIPFGKAITTTFSILLVSAGFVLLVSYLKSNVYDQVLNILGATTGR